MAVAAKVKGLADFRAAHDKDFIIPQKLKAGIEALGAAGWEYEGQFQKTNGISQTDGSRYREEFKDFIVLLESGKKRIYCGSKALATKMRAMV